MTQERRQPHLVFGTREKDRGDMPVILRALRDNEFTKYHPGRGGLSDYSDAIVIDAYVQKLFDINKNFKV